MLRFQLRRKVTSHITAAHRPRRTYTGVPDRTAIYDFPVRILGPTLWCLTAAGIIYSGCAVYEVRQDVKDMKKDPLGRLLVGPSLTFNDVESAKSAARIRELYSEQQQRPSGMPDLTQLGALWQSQSGPTKVMATSVGLNVSLFGLSSLFPALHQHLGHLPAGYKNYTLLTSMFGHTGLMHLGLNMYGLINFAPPVARTRTFQGSGSHLVAFYLASGIGASLVHHLSSIWPRPMQRLSLGMGASGAIMAILGTFAMSYPDARIGIVLLPGSLPAQQALVGVVLFELYGLFIGIRGFRVAHAAHLGGLAIGTAYVYFDGKRRLWTPARRFAFTQMRRLKMV